MVKSIVIDDHANKQLENLLDKKVSFSNTGLIIGSLDESKDYIVYVIPTPPAPTESANVEKNLTTQKCEWIVNHGVQVHDMLVGGMDILGIYCLDLPPSNGKTILLELFRALDKLDYYKKMQFNADRLLFFVDSTSKNINMKSLNYLDTKATLQPCQIESQPGLFDEDFFQLNTYFDLNQIFKTPNVKSYMLLKQDLFSAMSVEDLLNSEKFVCLIDNVLIGEKTPFSQYLNSLPKKTKQFEATLMENLSINQKPVKKPTANSLESIYKLNGVCSLVGQFHKSAKIEVLKRMLIYDLMRSFYARVRLLVEDLDARKDIIGDDQLDDPDSEGASAIEESYQTPNRIHIHIQRHNSNTEKSSKKSKNETDFLICDYVFPDETTTDISERIKELFNYELKESQIVFVENLPPDIKRNTDEIENGSDDTSNTSGRLCENNVLTSSVASRSIFESFSVFLGAILAAMLAISVYYILIKK